MGGTTSLLSERGLLLLDGHSALQVEDLLPGDCIMLSSPPWWTRISEPFPFLGLVLTNDPSLKTIHIFRFDTLTEHMFLVAELGVSYHINVLIRGGLVYHFSFQKDIWKTRVWEPS